MVYHYLTKNRLNGCKNTRAGKPKKPVSHSSSGAVAATNVVTGCVAIGCTPSGVKDIICSNMRKEIHTRTAFAQSKASEIFERLKNTDRTGGNILLAGGVQHNGNKPPSLRHTRWINDLERCQKILLHYSNEFINNL